MSFRFHKETNIEPEYLWNREPKRNRSDYKEFISDWDIPIDHGPISRTDPDLSIVETERHESNKCNRTDITEPIAKKESETD